MHTACHSHNCTPTSHPYPLTHTLTSLLWSVLASYTIPHAHTPPQKHSLHTPTHQSPQLGLSIVHCPSILSKLLLVSEGKYFLPITSWEGYNLQPLIHHPMTLSLLLVGKAQSTHVLWTQKQQMVPEWPYVGQISTCNYRDAEI